MNKKHLLAAALLVPFLALVACEPIEPQQEMPPQQQGYQCPDGTVVMDPADCPPEPAGAEDPMMPEDEMFP